MLENGSLDAAIEGQRLLDSFPLIETTALPDGPVLSGAQQGGFAPLRIGLLNNMPDAALVQTERQFRHLVGSGVEVLPFRFADVPRGPLVAAHVERFYAPHTTLATAGLDALIVTGSEPKAKRLDQEPYYEAFTGVVDWAARHTVSTLFSCLAAHAAVLHLDGIERRPLTDKHSGVFACAAVGRHPLLDGLPARVAVPHSRWNDLAESDLTACGYTVLRRSEQVGVDLFVRDGESLMVFLQGHPEYEDDTLAREYRRDLTRFVDGGRDTCPALPHAYYTEAAAARLEALSAQARASRPTSSGRTMLELPSLEQTPRRPVDWSADATRFFRNWTAQISARRPVARAA